jgi:energy-coupling factor transporter ATP-binding protein EcfA2
MAITSVKFTNYKALNNYSVSFQPVNILVGPNNCGKSTVLSAFRVLEYALRLAKSKKATRVITADGYQANGHKIPENNLPISIENIHTDYSDSGSKIEFRLSNKNRLILYFAEDGGCVLYWNTIGKSVTTPSAFRKEFPINIQVIPVLGPIEQEEIVVADETVRRAAGTPRASRHFRNYWHKNPDGFSSFKELIEKTWPGMSIKPPELTSVLDRRLVMFCSENRRDRELFWAGFGFQIWCQLLTHISRCNDSNLIIIDEPEVYLHPDIQRQLLGILRDVNPDIILATHSTEILGEADPSEILLIDKSKLSAKRLRDVEGVQQALDSLGSVQNLALTQLARTRKILFIEGTNDYKIIRRFAKLAGLSELAAGTDLTPFESGGFSSWERVNALSWGLRNTLGANIKIGAVYDHDYWCDEQIAETQEALANELAFAHIHRRKEIENYLLVPSVLSRALEKSLIERERRSGSSIERNETIEEILDKITEPTKIKAQGQYIGKYCEYNKSSGKDQATLSSEAISRFDEKWKSLDSRLEIVPGKTTLSTLRKYVNDNWSVSLTDVRIIDEFRAAEIPSDLFQLLRELDSYRTSDESE